MVATAGWFRHSSGDRNCKAFSGRVSVRTGLCSPHVLQSFFSFPSSFCSCFPAPLRASPAPGDLLVPAPDHQASNPVHSRVTLHSTTELREDTRQSGEQFRVPSIYSLIIMSESISSKVTRMWNWFPARCITTLRSLQRKIFSLFSEKYLLCHQCQLTCRLYSQPRRWKSCGLSQPSTVSQSWSPTWPTYSYLTRDTWQPIR